MTLHGHSIAKQLEGWHREHGGNHESPEWKAFLADLATLMQTKFGELEEEHSNAGRFGMSKAGGCTRAAALKLLGYDSKQLSGSTRMTFLTGHLLECVAVASMKAIGYEVTGLQDAVKIDPYMQSYTDGRFVLDGVETILSAKTTGYKMSGKDYRTGKFLRRGFAELPFEGVRKAQPGWWAQKQAEMHGSGLTQALVLVIAKDIVKVFEQDEWLGEKGNGSLAFYAELIPYDKEFCESVMHPVWKYTWLEVEGGVAPEPFYFNGKEYVALDAEDRAGKGGKNATLTTTYNPCNYCDLADACLKARKKEAVA
jgi:hypothetical protein